MNDEKQKRINYQNVSKFRWHWESRGVRFPGPFDCLLRVRNRGHDRSVKTQIWIDPNAHVLLADSGWFNSIDHYSELNPDFQIYRTTIPKRALRIYGHGDKMGGDYVYDICPTK